MDIRGDFSPTETTFHGQGRSRRRPVNACATCRARKVKCDERANGCLNCERLQLNCVQHASDGSAAVVGQNDAPRAITGIKRKRTFRVCIPCRQSKIKCAGERPVCSRCRQRAVTCVYDAESAVEPAWVQTIAPSSSQSSPCDVETSSASPPVHQNGLLTNASAARFANCPPALAWMFAPGLPAKGKLRSLLEAYFENVHPVRVFAFVHRPTFMRMLDEGLLNEGADRALLHIMCALGARFYALDYSESISTLPRELIQNAGSQWAKIAEQLYFAEYSAISITKLKVLVLLHDYEARMGNYAGSFLLTGLIIRMAHVLQINIEPSRDILCKEDPGASNEVSLRESRRRLMWACYMIDIWAGSGIDRLTILNERDIKLQLPCNERQFLLQIPNVTELLQPGEVVDFIAAADVPNNPWENLGLSAYFVRIVHIWKRVLRYIKHLDEVQPPWVPGGEFESMIQEIEGWKQSHPPWMDFCPDNIYIRRASSQLGALFLVHCMYHHVRSDLHRISLPNLFKIREPFVFPPEQFPFMAQMQAVCFEHAQQVSILTSTMLHHGVKYLADAIVPSLVYNSSRIMLYYIARIIDRSKPETAMVFDRTIELVEQNNQALRDMSQMYPLAEPLYVTTEHWLDKVRESVVRGQATAYIAPLDPSDPTSEEASQTTASTETPAPEPGPNPHLAVVPSIHSLSNPSAPHLNPSTPSASPFNNYVTSGSISYSIAPSLQLAPLVMPEPASQPEQVNAVYYPGMENLEQPLFDLNELQNFFEWENSEIAPPSGLEALGPLGWNNLSSMQ
ncbi:hypothetical protein CC80DRAFT_451000 [Byssothecium circinans]|uniref:Zn(2)-C6 fungal-type domain-containing protein n=1 Tax=Byssothecium circinans TaxID=147558 RepID=A0A6A5TRK9_9PLEO|nr:hypothetical protein CC80DRAFT_451000 [Byssothecium circinans]